MDISRVSQGLANSQFLLTPFWRICQSPVRELARPRELVFVFGGTLEKQPPTRGKAELVSAAGRADEGFDLVRRQAAQAQGSAHVILIEQLLSPNGDVMLIAGTTVDHHPVSLSLKGVAEGIELIAEAIARNHGPCARAAP